MPSVSVVFVRASESRIAAFCGLRLSATTMPDSYQLLLRVMCCRKLRRLADLSITDLLLHLVAHYEDMSADLGIPCRSKSAKIVLGMKTVSYLALVTAICLVIFWAGRPPPCSLRPSLRMKV